MTNNNTPNPSLTDNLRTVRVGLRKDLEVSRHIFRHEPTYIVRDRITFQSQKFSPTDYRVLVSIDPSRTLGGIFEALVVEGLAEKDEEESFYRFIMNLHQLGFLHLPISDDKTLHRRHMMKQRAQQISKIKGFLFLRVPLWNPSAFLDRHIDRMRFLFSKTAFFVWLMMVATAIFIVVTKWSELAQPATGLLASRNVALMWVTLIGLKILHEFGHAFACRHYGGHVPEMGAFIMMFTPVAYVDATASWGFSNKWHRIIVSLAGMYVEAFIASIAVFVWAMTGPSIVNSLAYNIIFLASVITALFNINPLMRYDGYYIFSDLVEIPNLRARASQKVKIVFKKWFLGIETNAVAPGRRLNTILFVYGVLATIYRTMLILGIAALLATKMFVLGIGMAIVYAGGALVGLIKSLTHYLWSAQETAHVRRRAIALGIVALIMLPAAALTIPIPSRVHAQGLVTAEHETVIRAPSPGFTNTTHISNGDTISAGDMVVSLSSDDMLERLAEIQAARSAADIRYNAYATGQPSLAAQEATRIESLTLAISKIEEKINKLSVSAPTSGIVADLVHDSQIGVFLTEGAPIATIVEGHWQVRALLSEDQVTQCQLAIGTEVVFRAAFAPATLMYGKIIRISPAGSKTIELLPLTQLAGQDVVIDPRTQRAQQPYFEIVVRLPILVEKGQLRQGMTGSIMLHAHPRSLGTRLLVRFQRFIAKII